MTDPKQFLHELLETAAQQGVSDVHLSPGNYPILRIDSRLVSLTGKQVLDRTLLKDVLEFMLSERKDALAGNPELNFSYEMDDLARFRVSAYRTKGAWSATLHYIPHEIRTVEDLNLPSIVKIFTKLSQGLVMITGLRGHGRSTTLAALIELVNRERAEKIITVEEPIEYIFRPIKSIIDQREVGGDTSSFLHALNSLSRQDANIIMLGNLPDEETVDAALRAVETGHLVFAPFHAGTASQTIERLVGMFQSDKQEQIRIRIANAISGSISQRLVPRIKGGLIPAIEVMVATTAVRTHIRDDRLKQIDLAIETGSEMGMISLDRSLADLVRRKEISIENGEFYSLNPSQFRSMTG